MNNETITKILALPPGKSVAFPGERGFYYDGITTDDLIELARKVQGYEEMMEETSEICFGDGRTAWTIAKKKPVNRWWSKEHPLRGFPFHSALEAFQALKEKV